jgi:hypothetical protein
MKSFAVFFSALFVALFADCAFVGSSQAAAFDNSAALAQAQIQAWTLAQTSASTGASVLDSSQNSSQDSSQDSPQGLSQTQDSSRLDPLKLSIIGGVSLGAVIGSTVFFSKEWWRDYAAPLHTNTDDDYRYALNADKLGHFFTPFALATVYSRAFEWAGMNREQSLWWASGLALTFQTYMELRDGFSLYGFSWGDCAANTLGAAMPLAQHYIPALRAVTQKISFYPSQKLRDGLYRVIIDDYESTYHWFSLDVHALLPHEAQRWFPPWLALALGHSVKRLDGIGGGEHELFLALDWNLAAIDASGCSPEWAWLCDGFNAVKTMLNLYKLPAPAVRLLPNVVWYGLKF